MPALNTPADFDHDGAVVNFDLAHPFWPWNSKRLELSDLYGRVRSPAVVTEPLAEDIAMIPTAANTSIAVPTPSQLPRRPRPFSDILFLVTDPTPESQGSQEGAVPAAERGPLFREV